MLKQACLKGTKIKVGKKGKGTSLLVPSEHKIDTALAAEVLLFLRE
jgi:hypothetical protein